MPSPYGSTGSLDATLKLLVATRDEALPYFASPAHLLDRSYSSAPGKWTLRELLMHLASTEAVMLDRLSRIIADDKPLLLAYDENRWAQRLAFTRRDLGVAGRLFAACRDSILELAAIPDARGRSGTHSERGEVTFLDQLDTIAGHTAHHLGQIRAIAEGRTWQG